MKNLKPIVGLVVACSYFLSSAISIGQDSQKQDTSNLSLIEHLEARNSRLLQFIRRLPYPLEVSVVDFIGGEKKREFSVVFSPKDETAMFSMILKSNHQINLLLQDGKLFHASSLDGPWSFDSFSSNLVLSDIADALILSTKEAFLLSQDEGAQVEKLKASLKRSLGAQISAPRFFDLLEQIGNIKATKMGPFEWKFPLRTYKGEMTENGLIANVSVFDRSDNLKRFVTTKAIQQPPTPQFSRAVSKSPEATDTKKPWGVAFLKSDSDYPFVSAVLPDSSAERGGVETGMKITLVDSVDVLNKSWGDIFELFRSANETVSLSVIDNRNQSKTLKLVR